MGAAPTIDAVDPRSQDPQGAGAPATLPEGMALRVGHRCWTAAEVVAEVPHDAGDVREADAARRALAVRELVAQRAERAGLSPEALLEREVTVPEPTEAEARRFYEADPSRFASPVRLELQHALYAVVPGVPVEAVRARAERTLGEARRDAARLAAAAREESNCPSGADGGALGWLSSHDCAPEFFDALHDVPAGAVCERLVRSRHGFHVVRVLARDGGEVPPFERVSGAVAAALRTRTERTALRQYVSRLAGLVPVAGCELDAAATPLVQ